MAGWFLICESRKAEGKRGVGEEETEAEGIEEGGRCVFLNFNTTLRSDEVALSKPL